MKCEMSGDARIQRWCQRVLLWTVKM